MKIKGLLLAPAKASKLVKLRDDMHGSMRITDSLYAGDEQEIFTYSR